MVTILPARPEHAAAILAIQKRAFEAEAMLCRERDIPPLTETLDSVIAQIAVAQVLVAVEDGRVAGSIRGTLADGTCSIERLSVDLGFQGHGLGSALLDALERSLPEAARFELLTNQAMEGNVRFYVRHGYRVVDTLVHSDRITLVRMGKEVVA
jgi:ribosomal protein S18 acetylase RimI-like enzyme